MILIILFAILYGIMDSIHDSEMLKNGIWHTIDWFIKGMVAAILTLSVTGHLQIETYRTLCIRGHCIDADILIVILNIATFYWIAKDMSWCVMKYNSWICVPTKGGKIDRFLKFAQYPIKLVLMFASLYLAFM